MKYKVGDKVKVRSDLKACEQYGANIATNGMERLAGKIVTISRVGYAHYLVEGMNYNWTDEMFEPVEEMLEPVEEMSAEELVKIIGNICEVHNECGKCPFLEVRGEEYCVIGMGKNADKTLKIAEQWKADHEKKPIETENVMYIVVMDEKRNVVYEEKTNEEIITTTMKEEVLKKYCTEHDGKYYAIGERRCVVKE